VKFRKKPVIIEAVKFIYSVEDIAKLRKFGGNAIGQIATRTKPYQPCEVEICTLEDGDIMKVTHIATEGDWIIKGVHGEFYACKPDIFDKTYELVEE